ncbi:MAG: L-histidine N(alpha)-methyltransferase [Pseudolabrys sp.]|nr:L-histidine N(alpha)-methyltransferase [Pseudolabrys sp.]
MVALRKPQPILDDNAFAADVLRGLSMTPKRIPAKYFYDAEGSVLFEQITALPEYYPTRCELAILRAHGKDIAGVIPEGAALVEFGTGSTKKVRLLLKHAPKLACYVPVDISAEMLEAEAAALRRDKPQLPVLPVVADFCRSFPLPKETQAAPVRVGFFPGSTIGNFEPHEAADFLRHTSNILGANAFLIIGVDLIKDTAVLNAAYNDKQGVTAKFNRNVLFRINRELGANFKPDCFEHHAFFNRERSRIEMHLASHKRQKVRVLGETVEFRAGETIHTENSYKYSVESLAALARGVGWMRAGVWTDKKNYFSVQAFRFVGVQAARMDLGE